MVFRKGLQISWHTVWQRSAFPMLRLCSALLFLAVLPLSAQNSDSSTTFTNSPQVPVERAPDGRSSMHIQSIDIPTISNAPFQAVVVTENTMILPDGSKKTNWNHRSVVRDSSGRVFQERRSFTPQGNVEETMLTEFDIEDPNLHELTMCHPFTKTCQVFRFQTQVTPPVQPSSLPAMRKLPNGTTIQNEDLGRNTVAGVDCLGSREIMTIPAGLIGNEKPQPVIKEFWYSPQLGVNLVTKRFDPRVSSIQNFTVTELNLSDPDPKVFAVPEGYRVIRNGPQ